MGKKLNLTDDEKWMWLSSLSERLYDAADLADDIIAKENEFDFDQTQWTIVNNISADCCTFASYVCVVLAGLYEGEKEVESKEFAKGVKSMFDKPKSKVFGKKGNGKKK